MDGRRVLRENETSNVGIMIIDFTKDDNGDARMVNDVHTPSMRKLDNSI